MYSSDSELTKSINELQSDILGEKLASNPLMKASKLVAKNKALNTKQTTIVNAINELLTALNTLSGSVSNDLTTMYDVLGNFSADPALKDELSSRGANTVLSLATKAYDDVKEIRRLAMDEYEDVFHVSEEETQSEFILSHKPIGKIRMYIDGVRYFSDCFQYDKENNVVLWINDSSNPEGFDITDADVVFEYDW